MPAKEIMRWDAWRDPWRFEEGEELDYVYSYFRLFACVHNKLCTVHRCTVIKGLAMIIF